MKKLLVFLVFLSTLFGEKMGSDFVEFLVDNNYKLGASRDKLVKCDKELNGLFYVKDKNHILFMPDSPFAPSMELICDINGEKITYKNDDFFVYIEKIDSENLLLYFNDEVDLLSLKQNISIKTDSGFLDYEVSKVANYYTIEVHNLQNKNYTLHISKNLQSKNKAKLGRDESYAVEIRSYNNTNELLDLVLNDIKPIALDDKKLGLRVYFDEYVFLPKEHTSPYVKLDDNIKLDISEVFYDYDLKKRYVDITSSDFKPDTDYKIRFLKGFTIYGAYKGYSLKEDFVYEFKTKDYLMDARFSDNKPYLSSKGEVAITTTNIKQIEAIISKLSNDNVRYFINFNDDKYKTEQIDKKTFELDYVKNEEIKSRLDIGKYKDGIYLVELVYLDENKKPVSTDKAVYLSDISINAKVSKDEVFVFLNRLSDDKVISGAKVSIYSAKNKLLASGISDEFGIFKTNQKDLYKQKPKSVYVELKGEKNFLSFDEFYEHKDTKKRAFIYLASDILDKQDELKGVVIVKQGYESVKNLPIRLEIFDPNGKKIISKTQKLDEFGAIKIDEKDFELSGKYTIKAIFENDILNEHSFFVEAFIAQRVKNNIEYEKENYFIYEPILAKLSANYLVGGAASELSGSLKVMLVNAKFKPKGYESFSFVKDVDDFDKILFEKEYDVSLDENGKQDKIIKPITKTPAPSIYNLKSSFMINDNGKNVASYKQVDIYPYESMVGVSVSKNLFDEKEDVRFNFITINPKTMQKTNSKISAKLYKQKWFYSYMEHEWYLSWIKESDMISSFDDIKDYQLIIKNLKSGSYVLVAKDEFSTHQASIRFDVSGYDYGAMPTDVLSKATIKLDKKEYKKGDKINAVISSPLKKALMLVTLEENGIKDYKVVNVVNHSANVSFDIKDDFSGMYLKASILRVADKPSVFIPFKAVGEVYVAKDESGHKINLTLNAPKVVKSGEDFKVSINTKAGAKVYLFVVDEGVLNIINQKSPNPFEFFKVKYHSLVNSYDIYDKLTNYENAGKVLKFGGDIMLKNSLDKYQDPKQSQKEQNYIKMYEAVADKNGVASFSLSTKQDFNTKLRLDAIALKDDLISSISDEVVIKDDFMIKGANINYLLEGDEVVLPLRVFNNTDKDINATLYIQVSEILSVEEKSLDISLKPNQNKSYDINVKALKQGKANIAIQNSFNDKLTNISFDILNQYPPINVVKSGIVSNPSDIFFDSKNVKLSVSSTPTALLLKDYEYLINYPYGCSEQRSSKLLAMLNIKTTDEAKQKDRVYFINSGIKALLKQQKSNGVFGYFSVNGNVHEVASIYATYVLSILYKNGFDVPKHSLDLALNHLKSYPLDRYEGMFANFVLSENDMLDISSMNALYDNGIYKHDFTTYYMMASMLKKAGKKQELESVLKHIESIDLNSVGRYENYYTFSSKIKDLGLAFYIHAKYFKDDSMGVKLYEILSRDRLEAKSTQDKAFLLLSFSEYFPKESRPYKIKNGNDVYEINGDFNALLSLNDGKINIDPKGAKLYYSGFYTTHTKPQPKTYAKKEELVLSRVFVDKNDNVVDVKDLKLNDLIFSKVTVYANQNYKDVLIHEKAPSCLEIVNERIVNDVRSDDIEDDANIYHKEINDYSVTTFLSETNRSNTIYTPYKVVLKGECIVPPITTERMYDENISDFDMSDEVILVK